MQSENQITALLLPNPTKSISRCIVEDYIMWADAQVKKMDGLRRQSCIGIFQTEYISNYRWRALSIEKWTSNGMYKLSTRTLTLNQAQEVTDFLIKVASEYNNQRISGCSGKIS